MTRFIIFFYLAKIHCFGHKMVSDDSLKAFFRKMVSDDSFKGFFKNVRKSEKKQL